jgi:hypothetical protein
MEFLKKNYEKVILSVVLLGLAVAAALLAIQVANERQRLKDIENLDVNAKPKELKPLDLSTNLATLARLKKSVPSRMGSGHHVFNPVQWQKRPDGNLVKIVTGNEIGPGALTISEIRPLYLIISYEGTAGLAENPQYRFKVTRQAETTASKRAPTTRSLPGVGAKNDIFILREMRPKEDPTEFVLELVDDKQTVTVRKEEEYRGVSGYMADLKYDPERQVYLNRRVKDSLPFAGDTNKIVAITSTNVTVEALSNTKRTTIPFRLTPSSAGP